jgi:adenylyltransferase/sulfurtransferase
MLPLGQPAHALPSLDAHELVRYSRHLTLPQVGLDGQRRLKAARVLIIGAGGLGSPIALYLAAAGVGTIGLVDFDVVDVTNLQRQLLHGTRDVGRSKLDSARDRLHDVNPAVEIITHASRLTSANALEILAGYDIVVDGTDNFATRYLANDACVLLDKPYVYGSIYRFDGQASLFVQGDAPCYRCLYSEPPPAALVPNCAEGGVLGVLPGLVGTIMATEVIKVVLGIGETLAGRLLLIDALTMNFRQLHVSKDPACPVCGTRTQRALIDYDEFCNVGGVAAESGAVAEIAPSELARLLGADATLQLIDVREPSEWEICQIVGARLIPLGALVGALDTIDRDREVVVMCRSGKRGATAARQLSAAGFARVRNLTGGILQWSDEVDAGVAKY